MLVDASKRECCCDKLRGIVAVDMRESDNYKVKSADLLSTVDSDSVVH